MSPSLVRTFLYDIHHDHAAKMVPFAGHDMPLFYKETGAIKEHLQTRESCGLFDVSHMGIVDLWPKESISIDTALEVFNTIIASKIKPFKASYGFLLQDDMRVLDDLIVYHGQDHIRLVINGAFKEQGLERLRLSLSDVFDIKHRDDLVMIALQGPKAVECLGNITQINQASDTILEQLYFMDFTEISTACDNTSKPQKTQDATNDEIMIIRGGYSGEDGFEIITKPSILRDITQQLLSMDKVTLCGLAARDSLRIEAGLPLNGHELTSDDFPHLLGFSWAYPKDHPARRITNNTNEKLYGLRLLEPGMIRLPIDGIFIGHDTDNTKPLPHRITSGGHSPSLGCSIGLVYLEKNLCARLLLEYGCDEIKDLPIFIKLRGKLKKACLQKLPFLPSKYHRKNT